MIPARSGSIISTASVSSGVGAVATDFMEDDEKEKLENQMDLIVNLKGVTFKAEDIANAALSLIISK
ncbi:hypothetical protein EZV62_016011 [Acer yangbiense]|uniref:Uncharacterized protein n=1 Tax=Acer yangbiense TaxID=1000413 RepID=A0A5C7HPR8_9ROSI|nr:hypothetical protein EZV62_016011 [Acer yangbiense]